VRTRLRRTCQKEGFHNHEETVEERLLTKQFRNTLARKETTLPREAGLFGLRTLPMRRARMKETRGNPGRDQAGVEKKERRKIKV